MSAASTRLVPKGSDQEREKSRSPIAHLLHALNQPLTGLQCSLELASVGIRRRDEYVQTLRESLELVSRMRILVEALRELADSGETGVCNVETFPLDELVREITEDLLPVAQSQGSEISVNIAAPLPVRADRRRLAALMFRFLESLLSMTRAGANLEIEAGAQNKQAYLSVSWEKRNPPEHSPFSRQELGLLVARAGWEREGAKWTERYGETTHTCTVRLPLASANNSELRIGELK
jgi:two-component sensor histidine kinase